MRQSTALIVLGIILHALTDFGVPAEYGVVSLVVVSVCYWRLVRPNNRGPLIGRGRDQPLKTANPPSEDRRHPQGERRLRLRRRGTELPATAK
jgi:hypothetical protein